MKIYIKNMVSRKCKQSVSKNLEKLNLHCSPINLGVIELLSPATKEQLNELNSLLKPLGLELLGSQMSTLVEDIQQTIIDMIHNSDTLPLEKYSVYLSEKLNYDYTYMSNVFSQVKGITIRQFIINNKIEKVKEFLIYSKFSLGEIADRMDYSSISHLSGQFKKVTGLPPSYFRAMGVERKTNKVDV